MDLKGNGEKCYLQVCCFKNGFLFCFTSEGSKTCLYMIQREECARCREKRGGQWARSLLGLESKEHLSLQTGGREQKMGVDTGWVPLGIVFPPDWARMFGG